MRHREFECTFSSFFEFSKLTFQSGCEKGKNEIIGDKTISIRVDISKRCNIGLKRDLNINATESKTFQSQRKI